MSKNGSCASKRDHLSKRKKRKKKKKERRKEWRKEGRKKKPVETFEQFSQVTSDLNVPENIWCTMQSQFTKVPFFSEIKWMKEN